MRLRLLGFCGVDDSVDPAQMLALSQTYPFIEWGVQVRRRTPRATHHWQQNSRRTEPATRSATASRT